MTARKDELRLRLTSALAEVSLAEGALEMTLGEIGHGGPRAAKVAVTAVVTEAFARLRIAHDELNRLRELLEADD